MLAPERPAPKGSLPARQKKWCFCRETTQKIIWYSSFLFSSLSPLYETSQIVWFGFLSNMHRSEANATHALSHTDKLFQKTKTHRVMFWLGLLDWKHSIFDHTQKRCNLCDFWLDDPKTRVTTRVFGSASEKQHKTRRFWGGQKSKIFNWPPRAKTNRAKT